MGTRKSEKADRRLRRIVEANEDEWQRKVVENANLQNDIIAHRAKLGLPADAVSSETKQAIWRTVESLRAKHSLPDDWQSALCVLMQTGYPVVGGRPVVPLVSSYLHPERGMVHEMILTPDTDIGSPIVLDYIRAWQREHVEPIPAPERVPHNRRKLDWRPVLEWRKRHPSFTHEDIAVMLGYRPQTVRRKLSELESRSD